MERSIHSPYQGTESSQAPQRARPAIKSRFDQPELDALRFFAFAMVFGDHVFIAHEFSHPIHRIGGFGVDLFFCLSAYLIVTLLLRERDRTGTVRLGAFAMRRILRIWPLYFLLIAIGYLAGLHWPAVRLRPGFVAALLLMYGNVYIGRYAWLEGISGCIAPLWSISVEEQFYVGIPLMVRLGGRRALWTICIVTVIAAYVTLAIFGHRAAFAEEVWVNSFVQFQFFAAGGVIALLTYGRKIAIRIRWRCALAAAAFGLFYVATMVCLINSRQVPTTTKYLGGYLCALIGTGLIFISILHLPLRIPRSLRYLGKISYGLYVYHAPLMWFTFDSIGRRSPAPYADRHPIIAGLLVLLATIAVATLSYQFFEKPILRLKQRFEIEKTRI